MADKKDWADGDWPCWGYYRDPDSKEIKAELLEEGDSTDGFYRDPLEVPGGAKRKGKGKAVENET